MENDDFELSKAISWVKSDKLMTPAFDFDIQLVTVDGFQYKEKLVCMTSIPSIKYKDNKIKKVKRYLSVSDISIERCE